MPPQRASPRAEIREYNPSPRSTTSILHQGPGALPRIGISTRDRARAPDRRRTKSAQDNLSGSTPLHTRPTRVGADKEAAEVSTPANALASATSPTDSPLSECESPILPTSSLISTETQPGANMGSMLPPAFPKTPLSEKVPTQQAPSVPADPTSPTPAPKRRRVEDEPRAATNATPDSFQPQAYNTPSPVHVGSIPPALHAALLVRGPSLQMAQQNPGPGPEYPGSKVLTLRIVTHDVKMSSYTKSIVIHKPFLNGQIPAYPFVRHLCEQRWPEKFEAFKNMCDRIDMGMPNSDEGYKAMAIRNAAVVGGPVAKGGPIRMMQLFGLEFTMEVSSEDEWGFFWEEVLLQEPGEGLLTIFLAFHTKQ